MHTRGVQVLWKECAFTSCRTLYCVHVFHNYTQCDDVCKSLHRFFFEILIVYSHQSPRISHGCNVFFWRFGWAEKIHIQLPYETVLCVHTIHNCAQYEDVCKRLYSFFLRQLIHVHLESPCNVFFLTFRLSGRIHIQLPYDTVLCVQLIHNYTQCDDVYKRLYWSLWDKKEGSHNSSLRAYPMDANYFFALPGWVEGSTFKHTRCTVCAVGVVFF